MSLSALVQLNKLSLISVDAISVTLQLPMAIDVQIQAYKISMSLSTVGIRISE
jgi:hypothetical protein